MIPTDDTVRTKLLATIIAKVEALPWVGNVSHIAEAAAVAEAFADGKCVLEWAIDDDRSLRADGTSAGWNTEQLAFALLFDILIPPAAYANVSPAIVASRLYGSLTELMTGEASDGGQWPNDAGQAQALKTELVSGGGAGFVDENKTMVVSEALYTVTYRHAFGKPKVA